MKIPYTSSALHGFELMMKYLIFPRPVPFIDSIKVNIAKLELVK